MAAAPVAAGGIRPPVRIPARTPGALGALAILAAGLAGCAAERGVALPDLSEWERRTAVLGGLDEFEFSGRVGVRYADDGFNAKLHWEQDGQRFDARLSGPLGMGTVLIAGSGNHAVITDKDGETTVLADLENELYRRYGWSIPVESLRYWALGIPDPRAPADTAFGAGGELTELSQRGWTVTIGGYREAGGGQSMPAKLTASDPRTRVRLVIDRWIFHESVVP
ncbi:MAG TPA: lipoprotein insertase outer membrane protein LolB [Woeseiaceae bacterium]|nr:lipoprotein insertase outer membrane protein LolB [Woeseiaceae bacterium]